MINISQKSTIPTRHWSEITKPLGSSLGVPMACQVGSAVVLQFKK
jgi:hypothetical protein